MIVVEVEGEQKNGVYKYKPIQLKYKSGNDLDFISHGHLHVLVMYGNVHYRSFFSLVGFSFECLIRFELDD